MTFAKYCDNRFQELVYEQSAMPFSIWRDAEQNGLRVLVTALRWAATAAIFPWTFARYLGVLFKALPVPVPHIQIMEAQRQQAAMAEQGAKNKKAQKMGFKNALA